MIDYIHPFKVGEVVHYVPWPYDWSGRYSIREVRIIGVWFDNDRPVVNLASMKNEAIDRGIHVDRIRRIDVVSKLAELGQ